MEYVAGPKEPQTPRPFSDLPRLGDDRMALIVHRSRLSYLMLNRFPYNPGHLLAIPFREVDDLEALSAEEGADLLAEITFGKRLLRVVMKPDAFNIGFNLGRPSGGSIDHLHAHIVPRWTGDTNFMPVLGDTRILPESLDASWGKLAEAARALSSSSA
jgi:ATP adenylyltransferase